MTIQFLHPEMALWLLALAVVTGSWLLHYIYKYRSRQRMAVQPRFVALSRRSRRRGDIAVLILAGAAVSLLVAALARPQLLLERREPEFERQDIIFILDRSVSMRARDIRPSRGERAIREIKTFLQQKPEAIDRVGLVGFAGTSLVLSYLTDDVDSTLFYLDWIADDPSIIYGTDMGAALSSALEIVRRDSQPSRKLFIIVSDGEDQGGSLNQALTAVKQKNIRIHSIGIGSQQETLIPVTLPGGREEFLTGDSGRPLTTLFNELSLRSLAASTGGRYIRSVTGRELHSALASIAQADRVRTGWRTTTEYRDIYRALLAAAGAAIVLMVILL